MGKNGPTPFFPFRTGDVQPDVNPALDWKEPFGIQVKQTMMEDKMEDRQNQDRLVSGRQSAARVWNYEKPRLETLETQPLARGFSNCHDGIFESMCDFNADAVCDGGEFE